MKSQRKDISGQTFGQLTAIEYSHTTGKVAFWRCICSCGKEVNVRGTHLRNGNSKSCGHDRYKNAVIASRLVSIKHGMEGSPTYISWKSMKERCLKAYHKSHDRYKDVEICQEWIDSFESFLADMGKRPDGTSLDRIDNEKGYFKENCRWATGKQQCRNKRNNRIIDYNGQSKTIAEWSEITGVPHDTLCFRIKSGWSVERALFQPVKKQSNNRHMITVKNRYGESVRVAEWRKV